MPDYNSSMHTGMASLRLLKQEENACKPPVPRSTPVPLDTSLKQYCITSGISSASAQITNIPAHSLCHCTRFLHTHLLLIAPESLCKRKAPVLDELLAADHRLCSPALLSLLSLLLPAGNGVWECMRVISAQSECTKALSLRALVCKT